MMGWTVWFLYACVPPLFFLGWALLAWRRERRSYCSLCRKYHPRVEGCHE